MAVQDLPLLGEIKPEAVGNIEHLEIYRYQGHTGKGDSNNKIKYLLYEYLAISELFQSKILLVIWNIWKSDVHAVLVQDVHTGKGDSNYKVLCLLYAFSAMNSQFFSDFQYGFNKSSWSIADLLIVASDIFAKAFQGSDRKKQPPEVFYKKRCS